MKKLGEVGITEKLTEPFNWNSYEELFEYGTYVELVALEEQIDGLSGKADGLSGKVDDIAFEKDYELDNQRKDEYIHCLAMAVLTLENDGNYTDHEGLSDSLDDFSIRMRHKVFKKENEVKEEPINIGYLFESMSGTKWIVEGIRNNGDFDMRRVDTCITCIKSTSDLYDTNRFKQLLAPVVNSDHTHTLNYDGVSPNWQTYDVMSESYNSDPVDEDGYEAWCKHQSKLIAEDARKIKEEDDIPKGAMYKRTFKSSNIEYLMVDCSAEIYYYSKSERKWLYSSLNGFGGLYDELTEEGKIIKLEVTKNPCQEIFLDHIKPTINESENKMNTTTTTTPARTVNVSIMDNTPGILDDANRLVARYKDITTTKTEEQVKMEILMSKGVAAKLVAHNKVREGLTNEDILDRTGNDVKLRAIELHDLTWVVTVA
jgi:hypothetical protein